MCNIKRPILTSQVLRQAGSLHAVRPYLHMLSLPSDLMTEDDLALLILGRSQDGGPPEGGDARDGACVLVVECAEDLVGKVPCSLVGSIGGAPVGELLGVVLLDLAVTLVLCLGSSRDRSLQKLRCLGGTTDSLGVSRDSSVVCGLGVDVVGVGEEGGALAPGQL